MARNATRPIRPKPLIPTRTGATFHISWKSTEECRWGEAGHKSRPANAFSPNRRGDYTRRAVWPQGTAVWVSGQWSERSYGVFSISDLPLTSDLRPLISDLRPLNSRQP